MKKKAKTGDDCLKVTLVDAKRKVGRCCCCFEHNRLPMASVNSSARKDEMKSYAQAKIVVVAPFLSSSWLLLFCLRGNASEKFRNAKGRSELFESKSKSRERNRQSEYDQGTFTCDRVWLFEHAALYIQHSQANNFVMI